MFKEKIVIVEDEMIVAKDMEYTIESLGYKSCGLSSSWDNTVKLIEENSPTLILMDVMLGADVDGIELGKYVWETYKIPVIFVSAYTDKTTIKRAKLANPFGYLRKPFDEKELFLAIEMARYKSKRYNKEKIEKDWIELTIGVLDHGIMTINNQRKVVFHNHLMTGMTGLDSKELKGELIEDIFDFDIHPNKFNEEDVCDMNGIVSFVKNEESFTLSYCFKSIKNSKKSGGVFTFFRVE